MQHLEVPTEDAVAALDRSTCVLLSTVETMYSCIPGKLPFSPFSSPSPSINTPRYFPKDSPSDGLGHRHDWEGVIVYLSSASSTTAANVLAVCPSAHGGWDCATSGFSLSGVSPLIKYESVWPVNHACGLTSTVGGKQPLIAWESLPTAAQTALQNTDFGAANVPFKDGNFWPNLWSATW